MRKREEGGGQVKTGVDRLPIPVVKDVEGRKEGGGGIGEVSRRGGV